MARWLVELKGEPFDLEEFPTWFPDGDTVVLRDGGSYYLSGPALEKFNKPADVRDAAIQLIDEFFAVGSLFLPNLIKPTVGSIIVREENGKRLQHHVLVAETGHLRTKGSAVAVNLNGAAATPQHPTPAQRLLDASRTDNHLNAAAMLWADPPRSWPRLYRILEEIEGFLGCKVDDAGLCSSGDRERFARTANSAEVAGKDARHAGGKYDPPKHPMALAEADTFISRMLKSTLELAAK